MDTPKASAKGKKPATKPTIPAVAAANKGQKRAHDNKGGPAQQPKQKKIKKEKKDHGDKSSESSAPIVSFRADYTPATIPCRKCRHPLHKGVLRMAKITRASRCVHRIWRKCEAFVVLSQTFAMPR